VVLKPLIGTIYKLERGSSWIIQRPFITMNYACGIVRVKAFFFSQLEDGSSHSLALATQNHLNQNDVSNPCSTFQGCLLNFLCVLRQLLVILIFCGCILLII